MKKHRHRNGKLEFPIKWLGYSNCQNTWELEGHLSPALVQEYFQQFPLEKPALINAVFMTKILTKEPSITYGVTYYVSLHCYASLYCGPHLLRHNLPRNQPSI